MVLHMKPAEVDALNTGDFVKLVGALAQRRRGIEDQERQQ